MCTWAPQSGSRHHPNPAALIAPAAVDALHSRLEEEAAQWRQLHLGSSKTSGMVEVRRLRRLRLPF